VVLQHQWMEITMKRMAFLVPVLYILLALGVGHTAWAQSEVEYYEPADQGERYLLTPEEMDDLVAPIALYPDPLIAQILPAATFFDQIDEASRYVREYGSAARVDEMQWDISVRAVAHYPDVLYMLDQKEDWTVALGQAYIDQPQDVMDAIQRLRAAAQAEGNLYSTDQQQVVGTEEISIVPANPQYIYVPVYDPQVVYVEPYDPAYTIITFTPFFIGPWLNRDCDWRHHRVYYHGWRGNSGWVARSRPHIHDRRGIYINRNARVIHTNDRILYRDTSGFRQQLRADTTRRLQQGTLPGAAVTGTRPGRPEHQRTPGAARPTGRAGARSAPSTGTVTTPARPGRSPAATGSRPTPRTRQRPTATTPAAPATGTAPATRTRPEGTRSAPAPTSSTPATSAPATSAPATRSAPSPAPRVPGTTPQATTGGQRQPRTTTRDVYRGKDVQKTQPASQSGYGGYGTGRDATIYRQRGQSSRENMHSVTPRSSTTPRTTAPTPRATQAPSVPRSNVSPPHHVTPTPSVPRSVVTPTPTAPRSVTPAPIAPRTMAPAPVAPRVVAPAPAPAPRPVAPAPAPVHSAPMSAPSPMPAAPAGVPGGMRR
jgi:hypothetical protein